MDVEVAVFAVCAVIVLLGGLGVVLSRNPVHAALSLVATLFAVAVLFLNLGAQLLAAVQVIVYTGAIVVLILFVMMLLGVDTDDDLETEPIRGSWHACSAPGSSGSSCW
jgi:NADH-quinone oxidoreductase subunit J